MNEEHRRFLMKKELEVWDGRALNPVKTFFYIIDVDVVAVAVAVDMSFKNDINVNFDDDDGDDWAKVEEAIQVIRRS